MAVKVYGAGTMQERTVLTGKDLAEHKRKVWEAQDRCCAICTLGMPLEHAHFDHYGKSRGMNGSKRDDLDPRNTISHGWCHGVRHYRERDLAAVRV